MPGRCRTRRYLTIAAALALLATLSQETAAGETVRFRSAGVPPSPLKARLALERGEAAAMQPGPEIEGELFKPDGIGPFPAVVGLHGCAGRSPEAEGDAAARFVSWGYVFLAVDSFATRGIERGCSATDAGSADRALDALGALDYLARQSFVDRQRIAVVGASQGGGAALSLVRLHGAPSAAVERRFAAAIAFYPPCRAENAAVSAPTLILIGELDDWTPAKDCERMMETRTGEGAAVRLVVYPGAYHAFNAQRLEGRPSTLLGHRLEYDEAATQRAWEEVRDFLRIEFGR